MLKQVEKPFEFEGVNLKVTVSIGIAEFTTEVGEEKIIKNVRNAMLLAKKDGRNKFKIN
ncbi:diguanylate cyclase domain-containing protein [Thermosipho atlanticus]|uniref:diguanylate cyclase domain-containing protein n=1 Tax=Thermosipho atlanticus TaxID=238991 RepID=UPI00389AE8B8